MHESGGNGNGNVERERRRSTLTLTFDHETFHLDVKGEAPSVEVFMAMLQQATRYFEAQVRLATGLQLRQQMAEQQQAAAVAAALARKV